MTGEEWRPVEETGGWYEVSSLGSVRSWRGRSGLGRYRGTVTSRRKEPRPLKPSFGNRSGHARVRLVLEDGTKVTRCVHSLVAEAFIGQRPTGLQVCHWDGDPTNNWVGNLRYDSAAANAADRERHGNTCRGEKNGNAKLDRGAAKKIRWLHKNGMQAKDIAGLFGVCRETVYSIVNGLRWVE